MEKRIAVIISDRQQEGLRMALGLLYLDDVADLFLMDHPLEDDPKIQTHIQTAVEMEMKLYANCPNSSEFEILSNEEIANRLLEYDAVLKY
jgi:hypothetical protein